MQAFNSRIQEKSHLLSLQLPPPPRSSFAVKSGDRRFNYLMSCETMTMASLAEGSINFMVAKGKTKFL